MLQPFDALYVELENAIRSAEATLQGIDLYLQAITLVRKSIDRLHILAAEHLETTDDEIHFFRYVWPVFYGELFFYIRVYKLELCRSSTPPAAWPEVVAREQETVQAFLRNNSEFWQYYISKAAAVDGQFTRAYSRANIFEPLAMLVDQERATMASYRAASCIEMIRYGEWLGDVRTQLSTGSLPAADLGYGFDGSDAEFVEWLLGMHAVGVIFYNGQRADLSRVQKWAKLALGREVSNIYDRARVLRSRKKERMVFMKKMMAALEKRWNEADGKFE